MNIERWKELWPDLTEEQLQAAAEHLDAYLELAWEIFEDMQAAHVDRSGGSAYDLGERSIPRIN